MLLRLANVRRKIAIWVECQNFVQNSGRFSEILEAIGFRYSVSISPVGILHPSPPKSGFGECGGSRIVRYLMASCCWASIRKIRLQADTGSSLLLRELEIHVAIFAEKRSTWPIQANAREQQPRPVIQSMIGRGCGLRARSEESVPGMKSSLSHAPFRLRKAWSRKSQYQRARSCI